MATYRIIYKEDMSVTVGKKKFNTLQELKDEVNATDMAKPFGKRPADWLRLPTTKAFLNSLSEVRKMHITPNIPDVGKSHFGFVVTKRGGDNHAEQGTWMHEDVALEFARWLSPVWRLGRTGCSRLSRPR